MITIRMITDPLPPLDQTAPEVAAAIERIELELAQGPPGATGLGAVSAAARGAAAER